MLKVISSFALFFLLLLLEGSKAKLFDAHVEVCLMAK